MTASKSSSYSRSSSVPAESVETVSIKVDEAAASEGGDEESSVDSADEALMEMLGLSSMNAIVDEEEPNNKGDVQAISSTKRATRYQLPILTDEDISRLVVSHHLQSRYETESLCVLPPELSIPAEYMRRLTDELVWGGDQVQADKTYETVQWASQQGEVQTKRSLTRLEHFVDAHEDWSDLCHNYLRRLVSKALGVNMVLYKEKLNIKPPGGSGFAPHLDTPSLRIALGETGPQTFCTVMVAIDDMTLANGCLRISKGPWSEEHCVSTIAPEVDGNPDAGGRAGAIPLEVANALDYEPLVCKGGTIAIFNGWAPHRSSANGSLFPRRAVFLTYNPENEGDFHKRYYEQMDEKRRMWRDSVGLTSRQQQQDERMELEALTTIPTI